MDINVKYPSKYKIRVKKTTKKFVGDSVVVKKQKTQIVQLSELQDSINNNLQNNTQTLLLGGGRTEFFVTEDSRTYISNKQQYKKDCKYDYIDPRGYFDSVHLRYVKTYTARELQQKRIVSEFRNARDVAASFRIALKFDLSPIRMWQVSLAGAVLFGMISMSMIYKNLGQSVLASNDDGVVTTGDKVATLIVEKSEIKDEVVAAIGETPIVKKVEETAIQKEEKIISVDSISEKVENLVAVNNKADVKGLMLETIVVDDKKESVIKSVDSITEKKVVEAEDVEEIEELKNEPEYSLEYEAHKMVAGYPIAKMLPYILKQDPEVAKYLIAMAKQESQWGKRVPVLNGQDCYNYWGFRAKRKLMGSGGHTCFNSREDAVETVGRRIHELIYKYDRKTSERLIVWKCGSSCAGHSQDGVDRWIRVVGNYYDKLSG